MAINIPSSIWWLWRGLAAMLLVVVAVHAVTPITAPLERIAGSAFSATTYDVAIGASPSATAAAELRVEKEPEPVLFAANDTLAVEQDAGGTRTNRAPPIDGHRLSRVITTWSRGPPPV